MIIIIYPKGLTAIRFILYHFVAPVVEIALKLCEHFGVIMCTRRHVHTQVGACTLLLWVTRIVVFGGLNGLLLPPNPLEKVGGEAPNLFQYVLR